MVETRIIMGMPITVCLVDMHATRADMENIFGYFTHVDEQFSPFKETSELSRMNAGTLEYEDLSDEMKEVLELSNQTKKESGGFFDIQKHDGSLDTSGLVKGWAIYKAGEMLAASGFKNFYINAGGDIQVSGKNEAGKEWSVGITNPFDKSSKKIVKEVHLKNGEGIATSGTYERGTHIWNPHDAQHSIVLPIASITVIGKNIYEADRFATAAFAMGKKGIEFIERFPGLEGYMIDQDGIATATSGFEKFLK